jgi:hypothetical protein
VDIMTRYRRAIIALGAAIATAAAVAEWRLALAQAPMIPGSPTAPPPTDTVGAWGGGLLLIGVVGILLAVVIAAIRLYDMKRQQEDSAMLLQAKLSDALLVEPSLSHSPITATVHAPLRSRAPIVIDIAGPARTPEMRDRVLRVVARETAGARREVQIVDRMIVNPLPARHAA